GLPTLAKVKVSNAGFGGESLGRAAARPGSASAASATSAAMRPTRRRVDRGRVTAGAFVMAPTSPLQKETFNGRPETFPQLPVRQVRTSVSAPDGSPTNP